MQAYAWALLNGKILIRTLRQYGILFVCCFLVSVHCLVFYKSLNSRNCVFTIFLQKASQPRVFSFRKYSAVVCLYENFLPHAWVSGFSRHTMKFSSSGRFDYFMRSNSRRRYSSNFRPKMHGRVPWFEVHEAGKTFGPNEDRFWIPSNCRIGTEFFRRSINSNLQCHLLSALYDTIQ